VARLFFKAFDTALNLLEELIRFKEHAMTTNSLFGFERGEFFLPEQIFFVFRPFFDEGVALNLLEELIRFKEHAMTANLLFNFECDDFFLPEQIIFVLRAFFDEDVALNLLEELIRLIEYATGVALLGAIIFTGKAFSFLRLASTPLMISLKHPMHS
jgi:hypothetical protein